MTTIHRLEADSRKLGAVLYTFPVSGTRKTASWQSESAVTDTLALAKSCAAQVRHALMQDGCQADIDATNWPSLVAGTQRHIQDWNALRPVVKPL